MTFQFGLLAFPAIQQLDLTGPYEVFASAPGATVHLIWKTLAPLTSSTGLVLTPTCTFDDCPPLDVLCIPGGAGVNALLNDTETLDFVRKSAAGAGYLTSVCTGSLVLGAAGLLKGRNATSHWNAKDFLSRFGATPTDGRVVRDRDVITAGGVTSGIDFGLQIIADLYGRREAEIIELCLEYAPEPPFSCGSPEIAAPEITAAARERIQGSRTRREELLGF